MTNYYITPEGEGNRTGLDPAHAWGNLGVQWRNNVDFDLVTGGDTLYFKGLFREDRYADLNSAKYNGISDDQRIILDGSLGAEITLLKLVNSGWTWVRDEGTGAVYKVAETDISVDRPVERIFIGRGEGLMQADSAANVGKDSTSTLLGGTTGKDPVQYWYSDGANLEVYLYSETDPNLAVNDIEFCFRGLTDLRSYVIRARGADPVAEYITVQNLKLTGGGLSVFLMGQLSCTGISSINNEFSYFASHAMASNPGNDTAVIKDTLIDGNLIDKKIGGTEQYLSDPLEEIDSLGGDGVTIGQSRTYNVIIRNNEFRALGHAGINLVSNEHNEDGIPAIDRVQVYNNYFTADNSIYCRGMGIGADKASRVIKNMLVYGNLIQNTNVKNQIQGVNLVFSGNIIDTIAPNTIRPDNACGISSSGYAYCENVIIANNLVMNCEIGLKANSNTAIVDFEGASWYNNIVINCGVDFTYSEGVAAGDLLPQIVENNILTGDTVDYFGTSMTVDEANSDTDTFLTLFTNNSNDSVTVNSDYSILEDTLTYHAGKTVGFNIKDIKGHKFNNPPTIGAYEFTSRSIAKTRGN